MTDFPVATADGIRDPEERTTNMNHHEKSEDHVVSEVEEDVLSMLAGEDVTLIGADVDNQSVMATEDNQSTSADEGATSNVFKIVRWSMLKAHPSQIKVSFTDPGEEDPDEPFQFPSAEFPQLSSTSETRTKCDADGTRKGKRGTINLPSQVQLALCQ